ncbi:predicted protein [Botrytis cinerea T4]|uniref:Uncharacterized protein n=1 Tax=Botryotinia fuckeliana (strain T4) TaxID=999810 RepID=G2XNW7_BOTF4|nr:predicted protein [Botrytis cinerea T4]
MSVTTELMKWPLRAPLRAMTRYLSQYDWQELRTPYTERCTSEFIQLGMIISAY